MIIVLNNIKTTLNQGSELAVAKAKEILRIPESCIISACQSKTSIDARKGTISVVTSVEVELDAKGEELIQNSGVLYTVKKSDDFVVKKGESPLRSRPVVVGFGPAGMFAALILAQNGYRPIVLERGEAIEQRKEKVKEFWKTGKLDPNSNIQFGEGGAGAFSDGKLTTRINDPLCEYILRQLVAMGAPDEILHRAKPHIGTDILCEIVKNIRNEIIRLGGEIRFSTQLKDIEIKDGKLKKILTDGGDTEVQAAILAVGHSARETFEVMAQKGLCMTAKAFSVGVRIEHLRENIDKSLYGEFAGHPNLPSGEYQLSHRENDRAAYTFCMCPGGMVVAAASGEGQVVTNGMSYHTRNLQNSNSAFVISVSPSDFGTNWNDGIELQKKLESSAFAAGGKTYKAPMTTVGRLLRKQTTTNLTPSYPVGVTEYPVEKLFPQFISDMMIRALPILGRKLGEFDNPNALLTGIETRTSSPVRIVRNEQYMSNEAQGLYPCGEGAGYAGGIVSASVDGLRCALALMEQWGPAK